MVNLKRTDFDHITYYGAFYQFKVKLCIYLIRFNLLSFLGYRYLTVYIIFKYH